MSKRLGLALAQWRRSWGQSPEARAHFARIACREALGETLGETLLPLGCIIDAGQA